MSNPTRRSARPAAEAVPDRAAHGKLARHLELTVQFYDDGRIRVSTPQARGHASVARGPFQLWTALVKARIEATVAGYAMWRGVRYDLDELTDPTDPTEPARKRAYTPREVQGDCSEVSYARDGIVRPDQHHPQDWTPHPDGVSWISPKGKRYKAPKYINSLLIDRARMGLPTTYSDWLAAGGAEAS
jgi:hypothetical protein